MVLEKALHLGELLLCNPDVFTIFQYKRPSKVVGYEIVHVGADEVASRTTQDSHHHVDLPLLG